MNENMIKMSNGKVMLRVENPEFEPIIYFTEKIFREAVRREIALYIREMGLINEKIHN